MADYIPQSDSDFNTWQSNFITYVGANLSPLGLTAADLTPLTTAQNSWTSDYTAHVAAQSAAQSALQAKSSTRDFFE